VARSIATFIVENDLPEGSKLPNEARMQEMLDVGRSSLREALRLLETQGVLTIKAGPGGGPVTRSPRAEDLADTLRLVLHFSGSSLATLMTARAVLEPAVAAEAALKITELQLEALGHNLRSIRERLPVDQRAFLANNHEFHRVIASAAGNVLLEVFDASTLSIFTTERFGITYSPKRQVAVVEAHERILEALLDRDSKAAFEAMQQHNADGVAFYRQHHADLMDRPVRWS
jgi:DNA-binding FadR family transcriptional regulator